MKTETFESVWDAICDTPAEAVNMKARSGLMTTIRQTVESWGIPEEEAAKRLGVSQLRLNELMRGKLGNFSLDALEDIEFRAKEAP